MTAEMLLLAFLKMPDVAAHRLLRNFSRERGFNWDTFAKDVDRVEGESLLCQLDHLAQ